MAMDNSSNNKAIVILQFATDKDMSAIDVFVHELAHYEKLAHICEVIDAKVQSRISGSKIIGVESLEATNVPRTYGFNVQGGRPTK
jgi:hypothetical protein